MDLFEILKISTDCYLCGCQIVKPKNQSIQIKQAQAPIICTDCHQRLPISQTACVTCGLPLNLVSTNDEIRESSIVCGECLKNSPPYNRTVSAFHYEAPISEFITQLKFSSQFQLLPLLCDYLIDKISESYCHAELPEAIIPVPLHSKKLIQRGFNQSQLIADRIARALALQVIDKGIQRIKMTNAQSDLDSIERKSNVKGAFQIDCELPKHIAIVDDVVTTGMTVSELANQARQQGAKKIDVWCVARAYDL